MNISQRIFEIMALKHYKQKDLAEAAGISTSAISDWKKKGTNPAVENISAIADFLNVDISYLISGKEKKASSIELSTEEHELLDNFNKLSEKSKGKVLERAEMLAEISQSCKPIACSACSNRSENQSDNTYEIPLYDTCVSAGTGIDIDYTTSEPLNVSADDGEEGDFAVRVSGDSMEPRFYSGDIVLVEAAPTVELGEIGIFILNNHSYIKKRGENCLISINNKYNPIPVCDDDTVYCQGRVVKVLSVEK